MTNLLTDIDVVEISVVDKGASGDDEDRPRIVIAKRHKVEKMMTLDEAMAGLAPEKQQAILMAVQEAAKPAAPAAPAMPEKMEPEMPNPEAPEAPKPEDEVAKAVAKMSDSERETVAKALEERVELSKRVQALEDEKETAKFVDIAKSMDALPGMTTDQRALVLKAASKSLDAKTYEAIEKSMRDAAVAISKGALLTEFGAEGGDADADAQLTAIAKKLREEDSTLTASTARMKAMEQRPELYNAAKKAG